MGYLTDSEINTLENKAFRLQCEIQDWRIFRDLVEKFAENKTTFGENKEYEWQELKDKLESIKYL